MAEWRQLWGTALMAARRLTYVGVALLAWLIVARMPNAIFARRGVATNVTA